MWELDPVEGTSGWSPGKPLPGNLNMAYSTEPLGLVTYLWCFLMFPWWTNDGMEDLRISFVVLYLTFFGVMFKKIRSWH